MVVQSQFIEMFGRVSDKQPKYPIMKLSECCSYISDGSHFSPEGDSNGSYPMLSVKDMTETGFSYSDCKFIGEKDYNNLVQNGCKPLCGDVLVAKDGSYFKYAFALSDEKEQAILSSIAILRPIQVFISSRYLAYYMLTDAVIQLVEDNYLTGTAIKRVILKGFKEIPIIVPPLDSQNVFVRVLERADKSKFDNLKSQFIEMFGTPDNHPAEYAVKNLGELSECYAGATPSTKVKEYWENGTISWMSSGEVHMGHVTETESKITDSGYKHASTKMVPVHSVVIALAGQGKTRGTVAITEIPLCTNQSLCAIVPSKDIHYEYLYHNLKGRYLELRGMAGDVNGRGGLNLKIVQSIRVIVPPLSEQMRFVGIAQQADKSKYLS